MPGHHRTGDSNSPDALPKPAWNWPSVAGFVIACIGFIAWPYVFGPVGLLLAAIGMKRATSDPIRYNVVVAVLVLAVALFACAKGLVAVGDALMAS